MNDFLMAEIRGSELLDFFVDVFRAADRATTADTTGFNALINDWLDEFDKASDHVKARD